MTASATPADSDPSSATALQPSEAGADTGAPTVTVVVPTYRRAGSIRAAVDSVLGQTHQDFEIVVVDDASADETPEVVRDIPDPRVRLVVHERNLGGNAARATGVAHARGRYVAFLDSDDVWWPTKLERQLDLLAAKGPSYTFCGTWFRLQTPDGEVRMEIEPDIDGVRCPELCVRNALGGYSVLLVEKAALERIGGPDTALRSCQDWDLYLRLNDTGGVCVVREPLITYVQDPTDPVRISRSRENVISGHRHMYRQVRRRRRRLDADALAASQRMFMEFFANAGATRDVLRVVADTPARVWLRPGSVGHTLHMALRAARRRSTLGEHTRE